MGVAWQPQPESAKSPGRLVHDEVVRLFVAMQKNVMMGNVVAEDRLWDLTTTAGRSTTGQTSRARGHGENVI